MADHLSNNKPLQVLTSYSSSNGSTTIESPPPPPAQQMAPAPALSTQSIIIEGTPALAATAGLSSGPIMSSGSHPQRTLVLTSQQSAALTKHLMMQQQQNFASSSTSFQTNTHQHPQPSSSAQFYSAAASHPAPQQLILDQHHQRREPQITLDDYEDDEALVIFENSNDADDSSSSRPTNDEPPRESSAPPPPHFLQQQVIQHPSNSHRAHSPYPSTSTSAVVLSSSANLNLLHPISPPSPVFGRLTYKDAVLYLTDSLTEIGRNSTTSTVHFHVGKNSFVSRKHLQLIHDREARDFHLVCLSKNGVFVDDNFQRKTAQPMRLPRTCTFRFPSTVIRIVFESLYAEHQQEEDEEAALTESNPSMKFAPLKISIPLALANIQLPPHHQQEPMATLPPPAQQQQQQSHHVSVVTNTANAMLSVISAAGLDNNNTTNRLKIKSPFPSPTLTISAANSCPTSPRHHTSYSHDNFIGYSSVGGGGVASSAGAAASRSSTAASNNLGSNHSTAEDFFQVPAVSASSSSLGANATTSAATASNASNNNNEMDKPPYSYAQLIVQSISAAAEKQLTLSGIYSFITKNYQYYRKESNKGWQNSIRHNLSLNRYFIKVARSQDEPGKGSFWRIDPTSESKLIDQRYKKRRQRGSQCFRSTPYGMPRSAPVSPSHVSYAADSTDNSPLLHDMMMQSAPGSPGGGGHLYHHHQHHNLSSAAVVGGEPPEIIGHDYGSMLAPSSIASTSGGASTITAVDYSTGFGIKRPAPPKAAHHNQQQQQQRHSIVPLNTSNSSSSSTTFNLQQSLKPTQQQQFTNETPLGTQIVFYDEHHHHHHHHQHHDDGVEYEGEEMEVASTTTITTTSSSAPAGVAPSSSAAHDDGDVDDDDDDDDDEDDPVDFQSQYIQHQQQHRLYSHIDSYPSSPEPKRQRFSPADKQQQQIEMDQQQQLAGVLRHTAPPQPNPPQHHQQQQHHHHQQQQPLSEH